MPLEKKVALVVIVNMQTLKTFNRVAKSQREKISKRQLWLIANLGILKRRALSIAFWIARRLEILKRTVVELLCKLAFICSHQSDQKS